MKVKIVADSSANLLSLDGVDFQSAPLVIRTNEREFVDDEKLDVEEMADYLKTYKGKSGTACPGVGDYLDAFEGYDEVYCTTIISKLSGSYNAAVIAKEQYEEENPGKKVCVLDSYSTGAEMKLIIDKYKEMILAGKDFETIDKEIREYKENTTALIFCLESMNNLANNGRVSPAVAKIASILGIRAIGDVDENGLHPTDKVRGEKKATATIFNNMKKMGYKGGKLIIDHAFNESAANALRDMTRTEFPDAEIRVEKTRGLCTFYAEKGGLIVGFEREL